MSNKTTDLTTDSRAAGWLILVSPVGLGRLGISPVQQRKGRFYEAPDDLSNFECSKLNFRMSRFEDGSECNIYLDDLGVENRTYGEMVKRTKGNTKRTWYYVHGGDTGSLHHFEYDGDFESLRYFEDLRDGGGNCCEDCGGYFRDDDGGYYFENLGSLCYECYSNSYITCNLQPASLKVPFEISGSYKALMDRITWIKVISLTVCHLL